MYRFRLLKPGSAWKTPCGHTTMSLPRHYRVSQFSDCMNQSIWIRNARSGDADLVHTRFVGHPLRPSLDALAAHTDAHVIKIISQCNDSRFFSPTRVTHLNSNTNTTVRSVRYLPCACAVDSPRRNHEQSINILDCAVGFTDALRYLRFCSAYQSALRQFCLQTLVAHRSALLTLYRTQTPYAFRTNNKNRV